jgi:hypothetical protein
VLFGTVRLTNGTLSKSFCVLHARTRDARPAPDTSAVYAECALLHSTCHTSAAGHRMSLLRYTPRGNARRQTCRRHSVLCAAQCALPATPAANRYAPLLRRPDTRRSNLVKRHGSLCTPAGMRDARHSYRKQALPLPHPCHSTQSMRERMTPNPSPTPVQCVRSACSRTRASHSDIRG